jgi:UDP-N-acetyl-D-galactosamine dehydrogenase
MNTKKIAIIGLGYVGLPLAVAFSKKYKVIGYDINKTRIEYLNRGIDQSLEVSEEELLAVINSDSETGLSCSSKMEDIKECQIYIVTVPTPIDKYNHPDLTPLYKASIAVANILKNGDIVIYESTVYPGVTEEECVPILEKESGLIYNKDFYVGYSPERINPGDKQHIVTNICKVTSGSTPESAEEIDQLYKRIITAGTYKAISIKVAEAAKVIENTQRDINIAFVNELAKIFHCLNIDTYDVLKAAGTKWNFLNFKPGLVGGHCIGVDPYYLAQKAQEVGYHPEIILAGRRLNDSMGEYVVAQTVKLMLKKKIQVVDARVLILGFTFKENCPDVRNTKVMDIYTTLSDYGADVVIYDPWADCMTAKKEYGVDILNDFPCEKYDGVILAVAHEIFKGIDLPPLLKDTHVIYDAKSMFDKTLVDERL